MSWELTRREFIKGSIYFPSAVKAWMREQIDGDRESDEQKVYEAFLPFVAAGARELVKMKITWSAASGGAFGGDVLHDSSASIRPKMKGCDIWVTRLKGVGMPIATNTLEAKGYDQDGITWKKSNLEPREIEIVVNLSGTYEQLWSARRYLVQLFSPRNAGAFLGQMIFATPIGSELRSFMRYRSGLEFDDLPEDATEMSFPLRAWAEDPLFFDPTLNTEDNTMVAPALVGNYTVPNGGDWDIFPSIIVFTVGGTVVDLLMENTTTSEAMQLTRTTPAGRSIAYSLVYGSKNIVDIVDGSILNDLATNNDLGSFHLQPGSNNIRVTIGAASTGVPRTVISWNDRFLSL